MKLLAQSSPRRKRSGFTLIEIMVATVIMVILVGLVIQITSEVLKVWNRSSGKLSANAEARIAMDLLTQDLETAVFRNNGQQWLRVEAPKDPGGDYTNQTVGLKLFTPALDRPKVDASGNAVAGDICAVGYRLAYKQSYTNGPNVYALYRMIVDPKTTFDHYMGSSSDPNSPQIRLITTDQDDWDDDTITDEENYLAGNIVEFKVLIYTDDGDPTTQDPVNVEAASSELKYTYAFGGDSNQDSADILNTEPVMYADIILTVVSDEGLELLNNLDRISELAEDVVLQHGEIFTRRVNFMARPL